MSANLGLGTSGNTFRLVPGQYGVPATTTTKHISPATTNKTTVRTTNSKSSVVSLNTPNEKPEAIKKTEAPKTQGSPVNYQNQWDATFNHIAKSQLYNGFTRVKRILQASTDYKDTRVCYIDYQSMLKLVDQARRNKSTQGVMSLKTLLKSDNQALVEPTEMDDYLATIQMLENLGPPDHALIPLRENQIGFLRSQGCTEVYWPGGNQGITCLSYSSDNNQAESKGKW